MDNRWMKRDSLAKLPLQAALRCDIYFRFSPDAISHRSVGCLLVPAHRFVCLISREKQTSVSDKTKQNIITLSKRKNSERYGFVDTRETFNLTICGAISEVAMLAEKMLLHYFTALPVTWYRESFFTLWFF